MNANGHRNWCFSYRTWAHRSGAFAAGFYLGEKHLSEAEAQLQSLRDAQTLPLASVVKEAQRVMENLADRLELGKMLEERDLTISSIEVEAERLRTREEELIDEIDRLNRSIVYLQDLVLPVEISKEIHLVGNKQEMLPIPNRLLGVIETVHNDSIAFAIGDERYVIDKGSNVKLEFNGLICVVSPLDWNCCAPREAIFHYECKRAE